MNNLIRLKDVKQMTGLSRSTIYSYIRYGVFPKQIQLGERASAWIKNEVDEWIIARIAKTRNVA